MPRHLRRRPYRPRRTPSSGAGVGPRASRRYRRPDRLPPCNRPRPPADRGNVTVTVFCAANGGSGTTVVAATVALHPAAPALLVDLDGDLPRAFGLPAPDRPGVADWKASDAPVQHLDDLLIQVTPSVRLLPHRLAPRGPEPMRASGRASDLARWLRDRSDAGEQVLVDAGTGEPPGDLIQAADTNLLVTRGCYVGIRRIETSAAVPTGVVLVGEPGRKIGAREVERAIGAAVVARVPWDSRVATAIDTGLLMRRVPRAVSRPLMRVAA